MDSDSPAAECTAAEQQPLAGATLFMLGGMPGTKSEFGFPRTRPVATGRTAPSSGRRHPREPLGHGPAA